MKKVLLGLLIPILAVILASCGSESKSDGGSTANAGKMVIWAWDQNLPSINYAAETYKVVNPNSKVEIEVQNVPDTVTKISTFLASGIGMDLPDMVLMDNNQIQSFLRQFPGKFVNLSKLGFDKYKSDFSAAHWDILSHEGSLYAFPFDIAPMMMKVNTDILDAAGVDPLNLKTWEDVLAVVPKIQSAGFTVHQQFGQNIVLGMLQSAGVGIFDKNGNIDLLNPKVVKVIDLYIKLQKGGVSDPQARDEGFPDGVVAMLIKPAWAIGEDMAVEPKTDGKVVLVPFPMVDDASGYTASANDGGSSFFILETSKFKETAYAVGEIITTDLKSQEISLAQGLMPGYLPAASLDALNTEIPYYQGQKIWKLLSESAADTSPLYVPVEYQVGKDMLQNAVIDQVRTGTDKSAIDLLKEAADLLASQTGLSINTY